MGDPAFWDDADAAQKVIKECQGLKSWTQPFADLKSRFVGIEELLPEAAELEDEELVEEMLQDLAAIDSELGDLEIRRMLRGELDDKNCYLSINSGAGGTEACDWAAMLARMYERWAARRGWKCEEVDSVAGDVAGYKSITYRFTGPFAYGYAKAEKGVHRLVRISPFDSSNRRHTSFASIDVTPELEDDIAIEVRPDEIRVDTFRASGAGGQHVNTTDSAVRITHIKTGVVVACQQERSQVQNKETALKILRSKLYELKVMEREASLKEESGEKMDNAWGSQIRNYVFHPYSLVKDTRTKVEVGNTQVVMDGDLDLFVNSYLKEYG